MGKQTKTRLWGQSQWDCVVSSEPRREDKPVPSPAAPGDGGDRPPAAPITSQPLPAGAPAGQMDRSSYFCPKLPPCLLFCLSEHTIETELCIRGFVWLITLWAHNLPHRASNANSVCKSHVLRPSSAPRSAGLLQRQQAGGSLLRSALLSLIISWK